MSEKRLADLSDPDFKKGAEEFLDRNKGAINEAMAILRGKPKVVFGPSGLDVLREQSKEAMQDRIAALEAEVEKEKAKSRELENSYVQCQSILEAVHDALNGEEVSDFMESFTAVRCAVDIKQALIYSGEENEELVEENTLLKAENSALREKVERYKEAVSSVLDCGECNLYHGYICPMCARGLQALKEGE